MYIKSFLKYLCCDIRISFVISVYLHIKALKYQTSFFIDYLEIVISKAYLYWLNGPQNETWWRQIFSSQSSSKQELTPTQPPPL